MSREAVRAAVAAKVADLQAAWSDPDLPAVLVEMPNYPQVDTAVQEDPFIKLKLNFISGEQANLGPNGVVRQYGNILIEAWTKVGKGTRMANLLLEHFGRGLESSDTVVYPARTHTASFVMDREQQGWRVDPAVIPFWYDETH